MWPCPRIATRSRCASSAASPKTFTPWPTCGERDRLKLANLKDPHIRSSADRIAKALEGDYRPEHLFALRQAVETYRFYQQQIDQCNQAGRSVPHLPWNRRSTRGNSRCRQEPAAARNPKAMRNWHVSSTASALTRPPTGARKLTPLALNWSHKPLRHSKFLRRRMMTQRDLAREMRVRDILVNSIINT